jgi:hypothetical protein
MKSVATALTSAVVVVLLAGCGTTPIPAPTFGFGDDAVAIARAVKACRAAASQPVPADATGISSIATCSITGSQVDFFVWTDAAAQAAQSPATTSPDSGTSEAYVAHGDGWDALTHDPGRASAQKIIAGSIVASVGGTVVHVGKGS